MATLFAISDLHVNHAENRELVATLQPRSAEDWLIVGGDVGESFADVEWALGLLAERFARVIWTPGNHELLSQRDAEDPRGEGRYRQLVELCRRLGVLTPEDPYPVWEGAGGPALVVPLFLLYDYSFGRNVAPTQAEALRLAHEAGVVCVDEFLLHPDPYPSREDWCRARVRESEARLAEERPAGMPTVLVNHFPLHEGPTRLLRHPEFAQWCGTTLSADWHRRFEAAAVVYGHLHIPVTSWYDGVRFEEVSIGYPREWSQRTWLQPGLRAILPEGGAA
jgi:3',5'-cyclic AMP phosphodiesterase CpdA